MENDRRTGAPARFRRAALGTERSPVPTRPPRLQRAAIGERRGGAQPEASRGWVSSSPWLAAVPRSSGPVARPHVREKHVGGANLRLRQGLGEGGHKAVGKPGQALIVTDPAPTALYGLSAVHVVGPGEVAMPRAAPAVAREGEPDVELPGGRAARVATVVLPARHVQHLASVVKG